MQNLCKIYANLSMPMQIDENTRKTLQSNAESAEVDGEPLQILRIIADLCMPTQNQCKTFVQITRRPRLGSVWGGFDHCPLKPVSQRCAKPVSRCFTKPVSPGWTHLFIDRSNTEPQGGPEILD